ncbi:Ig-like domain-containing protein [Gayadomonas joobiniege]|uniref:Ig-like domain-containing protein n=1 Tax=Gayadomonas joobiniege TaxID=1234606 RepID=UPI0003814C25|nr:Ig-like domain-containing protein [Gayadomonas joobiniege]
MSCFKHSLLSTIIAASLTACSGDDIDNSYDNNIAQMSTSEPEFIVEFNENDPITRIDLTQNVDNPAGTQIYALDVTLIIDEDGDWVHDQRQSVVNDVPQFEEDGVTPKMEDVPFDGTYGGEYGGYRPPYIRTIRQYGEQGYQVLDRQEAGILQEGSKLLIQPFTWTDQLAVGETREYHYIYDLDNGYNDGDFDITDDYLRRKIIVRVTGVEDPVTEINVLEGDSISAPQSSSDPSANDYYPIAVNAEVMPNYASYPALIWESADPSVAKVMFTEDDPNTAVNESLQATILGVAAESDTVDGVTQITARLAGGANKDTIMKTIDVIVPRLPTGPVRTELQISGMVTSGNYNLEADENLQLSVRVIPDDPAIDIDRSVTWASSNPAAVTVSEQGLVTVVDRAQGPATITVTTNTDNRISALTINPVPSTSILADNAGFESGAVLPWEKKWQSPTADGTASPSKIVVTDAAKKDGDKGLHLTGVTPHGAKNTTGGISISAAEFKKIRPANFADGSKNRKFRMSWDMKVNNAVEGTPVKHRPVILLQTPWAQQYPTAAVTEVTSDAWATYHVEFDEPDFSEVQTNNGLVNNVDDDGKLLQDNIMLIHEILSGVTTLDIYYDNIRFKCIENCSE